MKTNIDFYSKSKYTIYFSIAIFVAGIISMIFHYVKTDEVFNYGIDFASGTQVDVTITSPDEEISADDLRLILEESEIDGKNLSGLHIVSTKGASSRPGEYSFTIKYKSLEEKVIEEQAPIVNDQAANQIENNEVESTDEEIIENEITADSQEEVIEEEVSPDLQENDTIEAESTEEEAIEEESAQESEVVPEAEIIEETQPVNTDQGVQLEYPPTLVLSSIAEKYGAFKSDENDEDGAILIERVQTFDNEVSSDIKLIYTLVSVLVIGLILIYLAMRFQARYGIAAVLCLLHDILLMASIISISNWFPRFDIQFDTQVVVAILFTIGYSLNDTIVVFDRIRENAMRVEHDRFVYEVNRAINQSLSRTIITSLTTLIALLAILIFAGPDVFDLASSLIIGVLIGTYSSVFIASPIVVKWKNISYAKSLTSSQSKKNSSVKKAKTSIKKKPA